MIEPASLDSLETPRLILERRVFEANLERMKDRAGALGVAFRPHLKTAKSAHVARLAAATSCAITVSTLKEADYFADQGFRDILYAVGIVPNKLAHVARLVRQGVNLTLILDTVVAADAVVSMVKDQGVKVSVLIEIDSDGHRAGVTPDDKQLLPIARRLCDTSSVLLDGVITHAGASYTCLSVEDIADMAEMERTRAVAAAEVLRSSSLPCNTVSVGSTPTALFARHLRGVTELRAGVYMFNDLTMAHLGVCSVQDIALSVMCSVIGYAGKRNALIVDAGWTSLSREKGPGSDEAQHSYGKVCDYAGNVIEGLRVVDTNQEHGLVARSNGGAIDPAQFPIGTRLRILPVHACATAAQFSSYVVVDGSPQIVDTWERLTGW